MAFWEKLAEPPEAFNGGGGSLNESETPRSRTLVRASRSAAQREVA